MRVVVLISIISSRLESYTCCTYLCVEYYESAEPVKKKGWKHRPDQAMQVKVERQFAKQTHFQQDVVV